MIEDGKGDLVDVEVFCSSICFEDHTGESAFGHAWPCYEQADYDVYCPHCGAVSVEALDYEAVG